MQPLHCGRSIVIGTLAVVQNTKLIKQDALSPGAQLGVTLYMVSKQWRAASLPGICRPVHAGH